MLHQMPFNPKVGKEMSQNAKGIRKALKMMPIKDGGVVCPVP